MQVHEAVATRRSVRAFLQTPVEGSVVRDLLARAARAPSGGNLQPWHVHALSGEPLRRLLAQVETDGPSEVPSHPVYPPNLPEPYRTRRYRVGEDLYATIPVAREDKAGRLRQLARNAGFFGAPVGLFVFVDRQMGSAQWADVGMFLQTFLLLATEQRLGTCAQAYWSLHAATAEQFLNIPENQQLFCGIALGHPDPDAPINTLKTHRAPETEWCSLHGFDD